MNAHHPQTPNASRPVLNRFQHQRQVRWVDTDASGAVHVSAFVRMLEETEYAFLRKCGLSVVLTDEKGLMGFPRLSTNVTMQTPLFFDDVVTVEIRLLEVDGKMVEYDFSVWRNDNNEAVTANDDESDLVGTGNFKVAVCRFPGDQLPYAVLTPQYVMDALTKNLN